MQPFTCLRLAPVAAALLLLAQGLAATTWVTYEQRHIANCAPIIVLGEIVAIDVAKAQTKEGKVLRYLDGARIKVEKVYKNELSDVTVKEGGELTAFMHSTNGAVPGTEKKGAKAVFRTSSDLRYPVGTRAVWFVFVNKEDGQLLINRHPQQCLVLKKGKAAPVGAAYAATRDKMPRAKWAREDRSNLRR